MLFLRQISVVSLVAALGCETIHVDPPVEFVERDGGSTSGETILVAGIYREQLFAPLREGDPLPIVFGTQGGTWVMPGIRVQGLAAECTWVGSLTLKETGELIETPVETPVRLNRAPDGWLEVTALPIPVVHAAPNESDPIDDLYGAEAELEIILTDKRGVSIGKRVAVLLTRG